MTVYSTNGGNAKLILHDSLNDDILSAKPHKVELLDRDTGGEVYKITARKSKNVAVHADRRAGQPSRSGTSPVRAVGQFLCVFRFVLFRPLPRSR